MFDISIQGITKNYYNDYLIWLWPWYRQGSKGAKYYSVNFQMYFKSKEDYWKYIGSYEEACRKKKILGFSLSDVFVEWVQFKFANSIVLLLDNIDLEMKSKDFWALVSPQNRIELQKDVVIFLLTDKTEGLRILESISPEFADAYLIVHGRHIANNVTVAYEYEAVAE